MVKKIMYFDNITNKELCSLPKPYTDNFSITLTDILHKTGGSFDNKLFLIEEIVTDSVYRIYPMFNTVRINSSNPNDKVLENRVLIAVKQEKETYITFISDESLSVQDYSNYGTYYRIGDSLTTNQYNSVVDLIRNNTVLNEDLHIQTDLIHNEYGDYSFIFDGLIVDNGIRISDLTRLQCRLTNPVFHYCTYTLNLKVLRITNTNVGDETVDNKTIIPISVTLEDNDWVDIPVTDLELEDVILYDCNVIIRFDVPVIPDIPKHIYLSTNKPIIQTGETSDITATVKDIGGVLVGSEHDIYFYEQYYPVITLSTDKQVIQVGDKSNIKAKLTDTDGSIVTESTRIDFYEEFTPAVNMSCPTPVIQVGDTANIQAKVTDTADGSLVGGIRVDFYEEFNPSITVDCSNPIIQSGSNADITAKVKDEDGSLVSDETVYFYVEEE